MAAPEITLDLLTGVSVHQLPLPSEAHYALRLPALPARLRWNDLGLKVRTMLGVQRLAPEPRDLSRVTVGQLLELPGFGATSLLDLLTCIQRWEGLPTRARPSAAGALSAGPGEYLPLLPHPATPESLDVGERTRNFLRRLLSFRLVADLSEVGNLRVEDVRWVRGFSAKALRELWEVGGRLDETPNPSAAGEPAAAEGDRQTSGPAPPGCLPYLPDAARWEDLCLSTRLANRLPRLYRRPADLSGMPLARLLEIGGLGKKSLVALVSAMEASVDPALRMVTPPVKPSHGVRREARRLARAIKRCPSSRYIRRSDIRFGSGIRALDLGARNAAEMAEGILRRGLFETVYPSTRNRLREFLLLLRDCRKATLEAELSELLGFVEKERHRRVVARVLGWDGRPGGTLRKAGAEFGITCERARQICEPARRMLSGPHFVPALDAALEYISKHANRWSAEIEAGLQSDGLTAGLFPLEGILKAAQLFERRPAFRIRLLGGRPFVLSETSDVVANDVLRIACRQVGHSGALTLADLSSRVSAARGFPVNEGVVRQIVETREDFRWLDEQTGWFWLAAVSRNTLLSRIRKVLCVAPRIGVPELCEALARDYRLPGFSLPAAALRALCEQLPWCRVAGQSIEAVVVPDPAVTLSKQEFTLVGILRRAGGALPLSELQSMALASGIGLPSLKQLISVSPVLRRHAREVYGVLGTHPDPAVAVRGRLSPLRHGTHVLQDYGRLPQERIWIGFKLSPAMMRSGVFGVPAALQSVIKGEYALFTPDGTATGKLAAAGLNGWGLKRFFAQEGAETGSHLVLLLDLAARRAVAQVGSEQLLNEYRDRADAAKA